MDGAAAGVTSRGELGTAPYDMAEIESEAVTMAEGSTSEEEEFNHSSSCVSLHC